MHPLIAPADLATHLDDPDWAIFDCRHQLTDPGHGRRAYAAGHIPGARFADTEADLCGPIAPETGRHPLPPWERFCTWLGEQGVDGQCTVVAYDDATGAIAARLWWMLRVLGHTRVAVLDGGFARWGSAGLPQQQAAPRPTPRVYVAEPDRSQWLELAEVEDGLGQGGTLLVDARTAERYRGDAEPIDPRAGHIPGAVNLPFAENMDAAGRFLPPERLRERLLAAYGGVAPEDTVHYCGSGVTACHNLLAQAVAGLPAGRLYPGSWSQWCADPARPIELTKSDGD